MLGLIGISSEDVMLYLRGAADGGDNLNRSYRLGFSAALHMLISEKADQDAPASDVIMSASDLLDLVNAAADEATGHSGTAGRD